MAVPRRFPRFLRKIDYRFEAALDRAAPLRLAIEFTLSDQNDDSRYPGDLQRLRNRAALARPRALSYKKRPVKWDILAGRLLAVCLNPYAGWRIGSSRTRVAIVATYAAAAYVTTLVSLKLGAF